MIFRAQFLLVASLLINLLQASAQTPIPVAERITTHFGRTTRVTLFSNHVAVVKIHSESENYVHQATLTFDEYMVYLQAFERCANEIDNEPVVSDVESRDSTTVLTLHVGPDAPRTLKYSPLASLKLPARMIASMMDDIQTRTLSTLPGEFEIKKWEPGVGDRVELRQGGEAVVRMVADDGTIVLTLDDSPLLHTVAKDNRAQVILKVIEHQP